MLFRVAVISALSALAVAAPTPDAKALFKRNSGACPAQCQPLPYPGFPDGKGPNSCDITTSCVPFVVSNRSPKPLFCACRHGYRPHPRHRDAAFRTTWSGQEGRVFVQPGVPCDTLCRNQLTCDEIPIRDFCWTNPRVTAAAPAAPAAADDSTEDAGADDAGEDAGAEDAGEDAGAEDAGEDAGAEDAGEDAGADDAGDDAGAEDAGDDAGDDAGADDAGDDAGADDAGDDQ